MPKDDSKFSGPMCILAGPVTAGAMPPSGRVDGVGWRFRAGCTFFTVECTLKGWGLETGVIA